MVVVYPPQYPPNGLFGGYGAPPNRSVRTGTSEFNIRFFGDAGGYFPGFPGFGGPMIAGGLPYPMAQPMMTQPMMQPMMQTMPQPVLHAAVPHPAMPAIVPQPLPAVVPQPLPLPVANPVVVMSAGALVGNVVDAVTGRAVAGARIQVRGRCLRHRLRPH